MPHFELQHASLPEFANTWPAEIERLVLSRLESEIAADDVRTIVLALTRDRQRVGVWINVEWENYPYAEDISSAAGFVSLAPWLDRVDEIARGALSLPAPAGWSPRLPLTFEDETKTASLRAWWLELHRALTATAIELGTKRLATRFTQPVGVFMSMSGSEARLVAFCHPDGAPLWPIRERRREHGFSSVYTHGSLTAEAMTMFFPQGEGADEGGAPAIRRRLVTDIESAEFDDDDLTLKLAGEPFPIIFANGHTSDELGGPANSDVAVALREFATKAGKLGSPAVRVELPDAPAFQAAFDAQGEEWVGWLQKLIGTHGAKAVSERVMGLGFGPKRMQDIHRSMASEASDVEAWDVVLTHFARLTGKLRSDWQWLETRALVALSRWEEVLTPKSVEDTAGADSDDADSDDADSDDADSDDADEAAADDADADADADSDDADADDTDADDADADDADPDDADADDADADDADADDADADDADADDADADDADADDADADDADADDADADDADADDADADADAGADADDADSDDADSDDADSDDADSDNDDAAKKKTEPKKTEPKKTPERGLAYFKLGDLAAARAQVEGNTDGDALAVLALIEAESSEEKAIDAMTRAISDGMRSHIEVHARKHPLLARLLAEHEAFDAALADSRKAVTALSPSTIDTSTEKTLRRQSPERVFAAPFAEDGECKYRKAARRGAAWVVIEDDERVLELREGKPAVRLWEGDADTLTVVPTGLVVASSGGLVLLNGQGTQVAKLDSPKRLTGDTLASRGALVACGQGETVRLARVEGSTLRWCGAIKANERVYVTSFGFVADDRLLLASSEGLVLVDCSDAMNLRPLVRVDGSFEILDSWTNCALLKADEGVSLLDVTALRSLWTVKLGHQPDVALARDGRLALSSRGEVLLIDPQALTTERVVLLGPDGRALDDTLSMVVEADRVVALSKTQGVLRLDPVAFDVGALRQAIAAELPRVRAWAEAQVEQWVTSGVQATADEDEDAKQQQTEPMPLGGLTGMWVEHCARLYPQAPRTVVNASQNVCAELEFERDEQPRTRRGEEDDRAQAARQVTEALERLKSDLSMKLRNDALSEVLREVLTRVAPRTRARELFIGLQVDQLRITDVLAGGGTLAPHREVVKAPAARSLRELMAARNWYSSVDAWALRAKREPEFRAEILAILSEGQSTAADRVAQQLVDVDPEGCARAWFAAADVDLEFALDGLMLLVERGNAEARARLAPACDSDDPNLALPARRVLGRIDEDATLALVRTALEDLGEYEEDDVPTRTLAALSDARVTQLKDALLAAKEVLARPGPLLVPLIRAGWTLDDESLAAGNTSRMQDDDFMGELFGDDEPDATATAARFFIAKQVASNARGAGPVWPSSPVEKSRLGWQRFFTVAWPEWERSGALDVLLEVLPARAASSKPAEGKKLGDDAALALQVLHQALLRGDARATKFADALEAAALPAEVREPVVRLARNSRLMFGWSLLKQGHFADARKVADVALADSPDDGQVHFFAARLAWLEQKDPRAALPVIEAGLLAAADGVGRARLINLRGAVFDELGDYALALEWFHKALAISDSAGLDHDTGQKTGDPTMTHAILSNIAEAHWKLGQRDEARNFADQAARRGSKTEIVKTILAETK